MRRETKIGFALLALLTLTAAGCDERPFTRDYARSVPNSVIQVGEKSDRTWEYVDRDGVSRQLNACEDLSPWNGAYSCKSADGAVELSYSSSKRMRNPTLLVGDEAVPLFCTNSGFWGDGLRFCIPASDPAVPPQPVPRRDKS
ncbi:hypothetical protein MOD31_04575 [Paenarthrobacter sp. TYUT067]|uniref:hypothetical protein n=1 Tax=Paenarthrobacter sp. TYUT067 TaxID=2926245 RepID=UPI00202DC07B|nr:hypothetical protein [Paenarthrobacter sp. TYUT067]MCM0615286.1 hypothetical protein [Paenarthrobacter sp. TYUT067]